MEFEECPVSGQKVHLGVSSIYWVSEGHEFAVRVLYVTPEGPRLVYMGTFNSIDEVISTIEQQEVYINEKQRNT